MRKTIIFVAFFFISSQASVYAQSDNVIHYETSDYKISFPGQLQKTTQHVSSAVGQLLMVIASYEPDALAKDNNHVYMVMETDYPDSIVHSDKTEVIDRFFRDAIGGMVKDSNYKLIKETPGQVGKYPSRIIEIDYREGLAIMKMNLILYKNKFIIIQTITETKKYSNQAVDKFFDSFVLKAN